MGRVHEIGRVATLDRFEPRGEMAGAFSGSRGTRSGHRRQAFEGDTLPPPALGGVRSSLAPGRLTSLCGTPSRRTSSDSLSGTTIDLPDDELAAEEGAPAAHQGRQVSARSAVGSAQGGAGEA